jgi:hypothetical protein
MHYHAPYRGNSVPTFPDRLSVPFSRVFLDFFSLENGTYKLSRNFGTELLFYAAQYPKIAQISSKSKFDILNNRHETYCDGDPSWEFLNNLCNTLGTSNELDISWKLMLCLLEETFNLNISLARIV